MNVNCSDNTMVFSGNNGGRRGAVRAWLLIGVCALLGAVVVGCSSDPAAETGPLATLGPLSSTTVTEGGNATITVGLDPPPTGSDTVTVGLVVSNSRSGNDFTVTGDGVTASARAGTTTVMDVSVVIDSSGPRTLTITAELDDDNENEILVINLMRGTGYRVGGASDAERTVNITDDNIPLLSVEVLDNAVGTLITDFIVGEDLAFIRVTARLSRNNDTGAAITIPFRIGGMGIADSDFTVIGVDLRAGLDASSGVPATQMIPNGMDNVVLFEFNPAPDGDTGPEMLEIIIGMGTGFRLPGNAAEHKFILTITD